MNLSAKPLIWIDVRTPAEFASAHVVGAHNIPLFTDEERAAVGTTYVQQSREAAIEEGLSYVGPRLRPMIEAVKSLVGMPNEAPHLMVYCARGGMRSQSVAWLLRLYGYEVETFPGGFQGYKRQLPTLIEHVDRFVIIDGPTGSGKTVLLHHLRELGAQVIDLEGLACHKGSAFGYLPDTPQPSGEMFACLLVHELQQLDSTLPIFLEGESQRIGSVQIPDLLFERMKASNVITIRQELDRRITHIYNEYATLPTDFLIQAFSKITKRLGLEQTQEAIQCIHSGDLKTAIHIALKYYDKAYERSAHTLWRGEKTILEVPNEDLRDTARQIIRLFAPHF